MSEEMIIRHCSPTLAGMKTGNMFTCLFASSDEMKRSFRRFNMRLGNKGLRAIPLRFTKGRALVYIYRPSHLVRDLRKSVAVNILRERGYCSNTAEGCLIHLMKRICECDEFPHEIGLFLGYPPEDVRGFIEEGAAKCKCTGCWKVYGDEELAVKTFAKYRKCTDVYCAQHAKGTSIERLTVTV